MATPEVRAVHPGTFLKGVDGDTSDVEILSKVVHTSDIDTRVEVRTYRTLRIRLLGGDAWEIREVLGPAARDATNAWFRDHPYFDVLSWKNDSFGRRLCWVRDGEADLLTYLRELGMLVDSYLRGA